MFNVFFAHNYPSTIQKKSTIVWNNWEMAFERWGSHEASAWQHGTLCCCEYCLNPNLSDMFTVDKARAAHQSEAWKQRAAACSFLQEYVFFYICTLAVCICWIFCCSVVFGQLLLVVCGGFVRCSFYDCSMLLVVRYFALFVDWHKLVQLQALITVAAVVASVVTNHRSLILVLVIPVWYLVLLLCDCAIVLSLLVRCYWPCPMTANMSCHAKSNACCELLMQVSRTPLGYYGQGHSWYSITLKVTNV